MDSNNEKQIKYHDQPENTLEKIYKEIKRLYEADNNLCDILACSGRDPETQYTIEYLSMLEDMKELQESLRGVLDNFNGVINDIEYEVSRTDISGTQRANYMTGEALGAARRTEKALY